MINEAMINQTMATEDLSALIAALENAENQLLFPTQESTPILASPEASQNPAKQETAQTSQQEVQAASKIQDMQVVQDDQGIQEVEVKISLAAEKQEIYDDPTAGDSPTVGLSAEDLAQTPRQLPETVGDPQNAPIDGVSLGNIDQTDIELLKDLDPSELKDLGLKDIELKNLQGDRWAEIVSSLQQTLVAENRFASNDNSQPHTTAHQNFQAAEVRIEVIKAVSRSAGGSSQQLSIAEAVQSITGPLGKERSEPQPEDAHASVTNFGDGQRQDYSAQVDWAMNGHAKEGTVFQQELQYSTDDGSLHFSALDEMDGAKLLEIQNAIQEFGGNGAFEQLLREINKDQPAPAVGTAETTPETFSTPNFDDRPVSVHSDIANVNVDLIPQEVVSVSIGRLLDTSNFNISSLSQATREQLMWLVNQLDQRQNPQDEYGDEGDEGDDDKKQARIREENRERKKRWRESNQDRNKDNDLRCRVTKRAAKLYGAADTDEKRKWMEAEFSKRKEKREAKERARYHDDRMSTSPCFGSYPQHHNHSGGTSATFSPSFQPLSNRYSSEVPTDFYGSAFRNRASSVAESTTSSINDGDGTDSNGALRHFLSEPETALNLLQNSELIELLSNNPKAMMFLQSIIECRKFESFSEGTTVGEPRIVNETLRERIDIENVASADTTGPGASPSLSEQHLPVQEITKPLIDISPYIDLSGEELEQKLATLDSDLAQKVLTELIYLQSGGEREAIPEAAGPSTTPIGAEMELDPDVQRILDTSRDHHHDAGLDLTLVNDKLINFFAEDFSFPSVGSDDVSHSNTDLSMIMDLGSESGDINAKLLQALQSVLNPPEEPVVSDPAVPPAPPSTPQTINYKKRVAPTSDKPSVPRKRHQSSPSKLLPELSHDAAQTIATFLQKSGWDLQKLTTTPAPPQAPPPRAYTTNPARRPTPTNTIASNPAYAQSNTYIMTSASPRPTIPKPPVYTSNNPISAAAAHAASFGNSAAMNQRLMPPPAYRPSNLGIGYGGFSPIPTTPKKKPDDRIVKAMGFPPMLAGIKKKAPL
ncbi:hypothetical protein L211DRAFT_564051 [Terfezia boudieri ATCC MYA-4762]|uniref:DUF3020 domain-containing protein n=1 Tax=Terfezia boudieri ATCC MYA-4762 TaxID=1051890 RepID=A0A3N4M170_9PEZI|nr:hypothetical protein L211DRAFT_564051 [Terfezia boudieri ATCC MYA-4762]